MDSGGITAVMMNYFTRFNKNKIHVDFVVHGQKEGAMDNEIMASGSRIFRITPKSKNLIKNVRELKAVFNSEKYDIVHSHADSGNAHILKYAQKCGIPIRISHSHNTGYTITNRLRIMLNEIAKKNIKKYATHLWACSELAGKWLYGTEKFEVIHNAIDTERFAFSANNRKVIRDKYRISDELVVGMCGRLDYQKNHSYGIKLFSELKKYRPDAKMLLVGDGQLQEYLTKMACDLNLSEDIIFAGRIADPSAYYSAMDVLIMPSLFEGLGVAAIEAQCSGLKCLLSDAIPKEAGVCPETKYLPISDEDINVWVNEILSVNGRLSFEEAANFVKNAGYDINKEAEKLQNRYIEITEVKRNGLKH